MMEQFSNALTWSLIHSVWVSIILWLVISLFRMVSSSTSRMWIQVLLIFGYAVGIHLLFFNYLESPSDNNQLEAFPVASSYEEESIAAGIDRLPDHLSDYSIWISVFWFAGLLVSVSKVLFHRLETSKMRQNSRVLSEGTLFERVNELAAQMNINSKIQLRFSSVINSPFTVGFLRPTIFWPFGILSGFTQEEIDTILYHELIHIRRKDYLINLLLYVIDSLFFFNPIVKSMTREIRNEMEISNDALVINKLSRHDYIRALCKLQELNIKGQFQMAARKNESEFQKRINNLINNRTMKNDSNKLSVFFTLIALVVLAPLVSSFSHREDTVDQPIELVQTPIKRVQDTIHVKSREELQKRLKEMNEDEVANTLILLNGEKVRIIKDLYDARGKGEQMMKEIKEELMKDGILTSEHPKVRLMFQYSDILNGKEVLGDQYEKYKNIFNRYFPVYDSYATTRIFRYN